MSAVASRIALAFATGGPLQPNLSRARKCYLRRKVPPPVAVAAPHGSLDLPAREAPVWRHRQHQQDWQQGLQLTTEQREALWQLARGWNIAPSILLTLVGAWLGTGKSTSPAVLLAHAGTVVFTSLASAAIAVASCAVNDYFDHALDSASPACAHKPLPSGAFSIDFPLLLACTIYTVILSLACLIPVPAVRIAIAASVLTTLAYTPLLKRVVLLKNASVAATVAAAPLAGALAAGAGASWGGLARVLPASLFMGTMICSREAMMDITDQEGDAAAGVVTLPVAAGPGATLAVCQLLMAAAAAVGLRVAAMGTGLGWLAAAGVPGLVPAARALGGGLVVAAVGRAMAAAEHARRAGFSRDTLSAAVALSMRCTMVGMAATVVLV